MQSLFNRLTRWRGAEPAKLASSPVAFDPDTVEAPDADTSDAAAVAALGAAPGAVAGGNAGAATGAVAAVVPGLRSQVKLTALLMAGALVGKLLGFLREIEMARLLGATFVADSFRGALTATLLPIAPLQGDMVPSVMIPLHRQWRSEGVETAYFTSLMAVFAFISVAITVLVWVLADWWVSIVVGGFGAEAHAVTVQFVRIMALAMPASTLSSCMSCIEISVGRSRITTIRASMSNIGIMLGIIVMAYTGHITAVAWGYVIAFNLVVLYGGGKLVSEGEIRVSVIRWGFVKASMRAFYIRMRPLFVQPLADQGNILLERYIGSTFAVGTLASLDYARTLTETALYLVSQPIGYVMLAQPPGESHTVRSRVAAVSRPLLGLALPAALFLCVFAPDIVSLVFQRGRFQEQAVLLTSGALQGISIGLWASTLGWILIRIINSEGRNAVAARIIILAYVGNISVNLFFWLGASIGVTGLGLGEATRGLIMLFGAAVALGCGKMVLGQIARLVPVLLILLIGAVLIRRNIDPILARLTVGGLLFAIGTGITLLPDLKNVARRLQNRRRAKREALVMTGPKL